MSASFNLGFRIVLICLTIFSAQAEAVDYWDNSRAPPHPSIPVRKVYFGLGAQLQYFAHYNGTRVRSTPPAELYSVFHVSGIYKKSVVVSFLYGFGTIDPGTTLIGGSIKVPVLTLKQRQKFLNGLTFSGVAEFVSIRLGPASASPFYNTDGLVGRYGASVGIEFLKGSVYFEASMLASSFSSNIFVAPGLGIGFRF